MTLAISQAVAKTAPVACLPKQAKLLKATDYSRVFDNPIRSSDRYFTVLARPNELHHSRLGLAFTKKRVKLAVARNRLKRISRESFRLLMLANSTPANMNNGCYLDFIVLAGAQCAKATNQQLFKSLESHWLQLNKKCKNL